MAAPTAFGCVYVWVCVSAYVRMCVCVWTRFLSLRFSGPCDESNHPVLKRPQGNGSLKWCVRAFSPQSDGQTGGSDSCRRPADRSWVALNCVCARAGLNFAGNRIQNQIPLMVARARFRQRSIVLDLVVGVCVCYVCVHLVTCAERMRTHKCPVDCARWRRRRFTKAGKQAGGDGFEHNSRMKCRYGVFCACLRCD